LKQQQQQRRRQLLLTAHSTAWQLLLAGAELTMSMSEHHAVSADLASAEAAAQCLRLLQQSETIPLLGNTLSNSPLLLTGAIHCALYGVCSCLPGAGKLARVQGMQ
jgi:hypothetical protein